MGEQDGMAGANPFGPPPIFILSFRHRDELAETVERAGWSVIAGRRAQGAERRFIASGATIAVVDARGALDEGLAAVRALADPAQSNAAALMVLLSRGDLPALDAMHAAGATHYLASPFGEAEFAQSLRFADRHAERLAGGRRAIAGRAMLRAAEAETWRWKPGAAEIWLSPALGRRVGQEGAGWVPIGSMLRLLDGRGRRAARGAIARLRDGIGTTAFAHGPAGRRIAHHLRLDEQDRSIIGRIEDVDGVPVPEGAAERDPLTGLADGHGARRWIGERLGGQGPQACVLMLAVSRFDMINAAFGRTTGDALLQGIARRIERHVRDGAAKGRMVARIAGSEFAIGLPAPTTIEEATFLGRQLAESIARPFVSGDQLITLAGRVGISAVEPGDGDPAAPLRRASVALAEAKEADAGVVRVVDSSGEAASIEEGQLEIDLRRALDQGEIEILFQPQVSVTTGAIVGVEALARWRHPRLGALGAAPLFAAAERSDFITTLSAHVQRKALSLAAQWAAALSDLRIAINVTSADIAQSSFADRLLAMIDESGIDRGRISVEVTESGLIADLAAAAALLARLRAGGLRVAIDDFGTGYSSLAYLKALPLDYLKIDQHLSQDIAGSQRDRVVVRGVIEMARSLGLSVIAEGVETEEQLGLLAREGCNIYQGFLCAPPLTSAALAELVEGRG